MKLRLVLLSCALAVAAFAADVTGKWTAETQGPNGPRTTTFNLKADGSTLTGTVSGRQADTEISDGKVDGDTITFSVVREMQGNKIKMTYTGKVSGNEIQFKMMREGSDKAQEMTAKKVTAT